MGKITTLSQIRDLYDLMDLFARLDADGDGRLGPGEISTDQILAGDREGGTDDRPDGYLQPWEIMQMRGASVFKEDEVDRIRKLNGGASGLAFPSISSLPRDVEVGGISYKKQTGLTFCGPGGGSRVKTGVLARDTRLPSSSAIIIPEGSRVLHRYEGTRIAMTSATLGRDIIVDGIAFPRGAVIDVSDGRLVTAFHAGGAISIRNVRYRNLAFASGRLESGELARPASLRIRRGRCLPFEGRVQFNAEGMVRSGTFAVGVPSPYGARFVHKAGTVASFSESGMLIEPTRECFATLFPTIILSGRIAPEDIRAAIAAFSAASPQTIASIKGLHFTYEDLPTPFARRKQRGYADPFNHTIYIRKNTPGFPDAESDIAHEAAHMRHIALQKAMMRRIAAATRHLDPTVPSDMLEEHSVATAIFSRSFDAQWSRAAGYDFHFSVADLVSYLRNFNAHRGIAAGLIVDEPAMGFMNSYGRVSIWEDIATQVEAIHKDPDRHRELVDPFSDYYRDRPDERRFASVYRAKVELLWRYHFITEARYRMIVPRHESVAGFCQTLNCP